MYMVNFIIQDGYRSFVYVVLYNILGIIVVVYGQVNFVVIGKINFEMLNLVSIINLCMYYFDLINIILQFYVLIVYYWLFYFEFFLVEFKIMQKLNYKN